MAIITISRGTLSGGRAVAECLADALEYPCVGREILQEAARKLGAPEEDLMGKLEAPPSRWARLTQERKRHLLALQTALAENCVAGKLVYHGLAGQFLLRDLPGVLAVRLIAPLEMRVRALRDSHHRMTHKAAEEFIHNVDEDRRRWVKLMYQADVEDTSLYDLTINLQSISLDTACEIIAEAAAQPQYEVTDDAKRELEAFAAKCREQLQGSGEG
ncbi:MAG: cytidylate kinase-like family protein [Gemmatimonadota bacterium]|nr:MAG: cytidylate kinase-like family protein [Gemmatimonadota bacterium]